MNEEGTRGAVSPAGRGAAVILLAGGLCAAPLCAHATAAETPSLAPSGYSGAINTPTADVIALGTGVLSYTGNNPELQRVWNDNAFGSINAGFGALPGLEVVGRLAITGDISCNAYLPDCRAGYRDLSLNAKYQLPLHLLPWEMPFNTRVAVGFSDYGGAATLFRQTYLVATGEWQRLEFSAGYSHAGSPTALMDGAFGSVAWRLRNGLKVVAEHDTRSARVGLQYRTRLSDNTHFQMGLSKSLSGADNGQSLQGTVALQWRMGGPNSLFRPREEVPVLFSPAAAAEPAPVTADYAADLAAQLRANGFTQVTVRYWPEALGKDGAVVRRALWWVKAEPMLWRSSRAEALGVLLGQWARAAEGRPGDVMAELTYMGQPTVGAYGDAVCLPEWLSGGEGCGLDQALQFLRPGDVPAVVRARAADGPKGEARARGPWTLWPRVEIGPSLRTVVGSEYGVLDYSLAAEIGMEAQLLPGLFWQGVLSVPVSASDDFQRGRIYSGRRHPDVGLDSGLIAYYRPLGHGVVAQASAGFIDRRYKGGQLDLSWSTPGGRLRLNAVGGRYQHDVTGVVQTPILVGGRWTIIPGLWQGEAQAGQFLGGDRGVSLTSRHWFGDTQVALFGRTSQGDAGTLLARRHSFIGFSISRPLGGRRSAAVGPVGIRFRDRFSWGLETKVGERDNYITGNYGEVPRIRHGLQTDGTDYDRSGAADLRAAAARIRNAAGYGGPATTEVDEQ